jgi:hypothetical protein
MSEHWKEPEGGRFSVAVPAVDFQTATAELETFFARRLSTYSYCLSHEIKRYLIVFFKDEAEAKLAIEKFGGEPFDPRDKGRGTKWMMWFKEGERERTVG